MQKNLETEKDPDVKKDIKAVISGMTNFYFGRNTKVARERYENHCKNCKYFQDEPIKDMRVSDSIIEEISGKMCGFCGCVLSYKIRQSVKKCVFWE